MGQASEQKSGMLSSNWFSHSLRWPWQIYPTFLGKTAGRWQSWEAEQLKLVSEVIFCLVKQRLLWSPKLGLHCASQSNIIGREMPLRREYISESIKSESFQERCKFPRIFNNSWGGKKKKLLPYGKGQFNRLWNKVLKTVSSMKIVFKERYVYVCVYICISIILCALEVHRPGIWLI